LNFSLINPNIAHQLQALIPAIKILPEGTVPFASADYHLLIMIGSDDWQFALLHKQNKQLEALLGFHFEKSLLPAGFPAKWEEVINEYAFLNKFYSAVTVVYRCNEAVLFPGSNYHPAGNPTVLNTLYGEENGAVIKDNFVAAEGINIVYRIAPAIYNTIQRSFINASCKHYYSMELQALGKTGYENLVQVNFFGNQFSVAVIKDGVLQLMQAYNYSKPEDVLFYLLTIAKEFNCNREEIILLIGGMVEEKSAMVTDIKKYFLNIQLASKPETVDCTAAFKEFPLHYFNPAFTIASCVL
jgi:Protein of unknown function (DUF3822)